MSNSRLVTFPLALAITALSVANIARADDQFDALVGDRIAIERVYYNHRTGTKLPFDQVMPRELAEKLVREDLHKEAVLKKVYGIETTDAQINAEVRRINASTRAPEVLAELKAALGNQPARFARTVAKPIVVDRALRDRFDNDDALHASQRRHAETVRAELLASKSNHIESGELVALFKRLGSNDVTETTWQLGKPPEEKSDGDKVLAEAQKRFGQNAQILSPPPEAGEKRNFYFGNLPPELQQVLRVQLRQPGDISAVIETPVDFRLYLCETNSPTTLAAASLSIPKRNFERWLAQQSD